MSTSAPTGRRASKAVSGSKFQVSCFKLETWNLKPKTELPMLILGIAGGIASGKSVIANYLRDLGAVVLDADKAGHAVLREPDVIAELQKRWGDRILDAKGQVSRREVAK